MFKLKALIRENPQLETLIEEAQKKTLINQYWQSAAPQMMACQSHAFRLENGILTVYADNGATATKIKHMHDSLLNALEKIRSQHPHLQPYKVTAIQVKVQVKYLSKSNPNPPAQLSSTAAQQLKQYSDQLGDSKLGQILSRLASRHRPK